MKSKIIIVKKSLSIDYINFSDLKTTVEEFALLGDVQVWHEEDGFGDYGCHDGKLIFSGKRPETDEERKERQAGERKERAKRKELKEKEQQKLREQELAELQRLKDKYEKGQ